LKVCIVNTYHYRRGGDCTYTFDLAGLLEARGHRVIHFAMKHPDNVESEYDPYFVEHIDFGAVFGSGNPVEKLKTFFRSLYSSEARRRFRNLLDATKPDIVHLQNFRRHLTFSIVTEAKRHGLPVVFTAHDYDPVCPNALLFSGDNVCEVCHGKSYYKALGVRCKEGSLLATLSIALEGTFVKIRRYYDQIDLIVTPSDFARAKLVEHGIRPEQVQTVHNFIDTQAYEPKYGGRDIIYFGRLSTEKGLRTLLEAAVRTPRTRVMIAGDGPQRQDLENLRLKLGCQNVDFLGYVERARLPVMVREAMCVVMPSICFENFPYAILEAFALGKPVVASRIGGMPEMVKVGETGLLFEPGDALALSRHIEYLEGNPSEAERMGRRARQVAETEYSPDSHYAGIVAAYERVMM
jgi:glycosyltransferase involved in cell wall biosynthesis